MFRNPVQGGFAVLSAACLAIVGCADDTAGPSDPSVLMEYWDELVPWNVCPVDLQGNSEQLTDVLHVASLPVFSANGGDILFLRMDFVFDSSEV